MSVNGSVEIDWADGRYTFNIAKFGQAFELEEKCDAGLIEIFRRVSEKRWRVSDLLETVRLGLIGGGLDPAKALKLTRRYVEGRPWAETAPIAQVILLAALVGVDGDNKVGKPQADQTATEPVQADLSDPQSMGSGHPSGSPREP